MKDHLIIKIYIMKKFLGVEQKRKNRLLLNSICSEYFINPQQVMEDIKASGYENLTLNEIINFIKNNY